MKLAKALLLRGEMQKRLASLRERIALNAKYQEGGGISEDPTDLIQESIAVLGELESLVLKINVANLQHTMQDGRNLTVALAHRDTLVQTHALVKGAIQATRREFDHYSAREIRWLTPLDVKGLQNQLDSPSQQIREENECIQEANWLFEI